MNCVTLSIWVSGHLDVGLYGSEGIYEKGHSSQGNKFRTWAILIKAIYEAICSRATQNRDYPYEAILVEAAEVIGPFIFYWTLHDYTPHT